MRRCAYLVRRQGSRMAAQGAVALVLAAVVWRVWRGPAEPMAKCAVLAICALLATPYVFDYDLMLAIVPICWLAKTCLDRGFQPWDRTIMAAVYLLPLAARSLGWLTHMDLGPWVLGALLFAVLRRLPGISATTPA